MTGPSVRAFIRNSRSGRALCLLLLMSYVSTCVICAPAYANDPTLGSHRYQNGRLIHTRHGCADVHPATHGWWENFNDWTDHVCKGVRSDVDRAQHVWDAASACRQFIPADVAYDAGAVFGGLIAGTLIFMAAAVLAYAVGAIIGGLAGGLLSEGVGAAAGARLGFKVAGIFLTWIGIGCLLTFVVQYLKDMIPSIWTGIREAWYSDEWASPRPTGWTSAQWMSDAEQRMAHGVSMFAVAVLLALVAVATNEGAAAMKANLKMMKGMNVDEAYPAVIDKAFLHGQIEGKLEFSESEKITARCLAES